MVSRSREPLGGILTQTSRPHLADRDDERLAREARAPDTGTGFEDRAEIAGAKPAEVDGALECGEERGAPPGSPLVPSAPDS